MTHLDTTLFQTKSRVVANYIRDEIRQGVLRPGDKLAGVRKLGEKYSVGRQVVLSAFQILAKANIVITKARSGTYVNPCLKAKKYYRIGFFVNHINFLNNLPTIEEVHRNASKAGFQLIVGSNFEEEFSVSDWVARKQLDGVIVSGVVDDRTIEQLNTTLTPFVIAGNYDIDASIPQVSVDLISIIRKHLGAVIKKLKLKSLATVIGTLEYRADRECLEGIKQAVQDSNLELHDEFIKTAAGDGFTEIAQIMENNRSKPEAFYFHGEHHNGFIKYFSARNINSRPKVIINKDIINSRELVDATVSYPNLRKKLGQASFEKLMQEISRHAPEDL